MHAIVTSEGVVLSKRGVGEANTLIAVLTREKGLLRIAARSSRFEKSKLRYGLEPLTRARFALVRGRHEWKLTGVDAVSRDFMSPQAINRRAAGRVARLLLRLIHGEEAVPALYDTALRGFAYLAEADAADMQNRECVLVLRILAHLGYVPNTADTAPFLHDEPLSPELAVLVASVRPTLIRIINESLSATGL